MQACERSPHAVLDLPSRRLKALKIERLLKLNLRHQPIRVLEIGTGSGGIAHYFATHTELVCDVVAIDVKDQRLLTDKYSFVHVEDTELPFLDNIFDIVISNHVIEHVGDGEAQSRHLVEIRRVLLNDGECYLAVPNRWMLVEPHYKLIFLSWLPTPLRSYYLRLLGRGEYYDCKPLEKRELERLLEENGFSYRNICVRALRETLEIENTHGIFTSIIGKLPNCILNRLLPIIPTLIYHLRK